MNLGLPELTIIVGLLLFVGATIWGIVDAGQRGQTGWLVGMIIGWFFGLGWLVALIYLFGVRPGLVRASRPPPPPTDPYNQGWG